ncbi:MAG: hypothetical protein WBL63_13975 [Candidatus Acidiferrum sp.]
MARAGGLGPKIMWASGLAMLLCYATTSAAQELAYNEQAEFDAHGNIFVSSQGGKLIWMGNTKHCAQAGVAGDRQTVMCVVMQNPEAGNMLPALQVEIYLKGGQKKTIEPGAPILEWHFWENGRQVALFFGVQASKGTHALYDTATGTVVEKAAEPRNKSQLPQWAKDAGQIQDESVPESDVLTVERTKWIAKVMRRISKIQPGMTRKDLLNVFTTEGGLSNRLQRSYVTVECPYIKVDVKFKAANNKNDVLNEEPQDVIESISRPYLQWNVMD